GSLSTSVARVVVWEWLNEHGRWRPYSATVCHHIENVLKGDPRGTVVLGQVEPQLVPYIIDLQSMHQFRQDTGKTEISTTDSSSSQHYIYMLFMP
uniref:WWE domain-containing protein n=1 Tax=Denticeps clupeoides TaxID=299321 RepID=A0AAY4CU50_9TELE